MCVFGVVYRNSGQENTFNQVRLSSSGISAGDIFVTFIPSRVMGLGSPGEISSGTLRVMTFGYEYNQGTQTYKLGSQSRHVNVFDATFTRPSEGGPFKGQLITHGGTRQSLSSVAENVISTAQNARNGHHHSFSDIFGGVQTRKSTFNTSTAAGRKGLNTMLLPKGARIGEPSLIRSRVVDYFPDTGYYDVSSPGSTGKGASKQTDHPFNRIMRGIRHNYIRLGEVEGPLSPMKMNVDGTPKTVSTVRKNAWIDTIFNYVRGSGLRGGETTLFQHAKSINSGKLSVSLSTAVVPSQYPLALVAICTGRNLFPDSI